MDLSVIVPCFNEEKQIAQTTNLISCYLKQNHPELTYELLLINDGSTDNTALILNELGSEPTIRTVHFSQNQGRGAAIKAGFGISIGDYVIVLDADLSYDTTHIGKIIKTFQQYPDTDAVIVSPYMRGGQVDGVPLMRLFVSRMANWILSSFVSNKLSTVTCVVRGYRGDVIRKLPLLENGKELHIEILRKLTVKGKKLIEIPGNLIWPQKKARRKNNLKLYDSTKRHLRLALLIKPTLILKYLTLILLVFGLYETINVMRVFVDLYVVQAGLIQDIWHALSLAFHASPHTVVLASVSLIIGFQLLLFLILLEVLSLQHEESLRHNIKLIELISVAQNAATNKNIQLTNYDKADRELKCVE